MSYIPASRPSQAAASTQLSASQFIPYTPSEFASISTVLAKKFGPEFIAHRPGNGGGKVTYIEGWKAIELANQVFGYNGWNSTVVSFTNDLVSHLCT